MNILELKRKLLPMSGPQMDGGGGGSGTGTQTNISELPEWARGYAKNTLEKGAALSEKPYQSYDQNRIAGFSPLQQQSQQNAANMQTSGATGQGIGIAGQAAQQALNTNYQGGGYGNQFQAPQDYQAGRFRADRVGTQSFTQPGTAEDYMSPYMQNVVNAQQREAQRSSDIMGQQNAAKAVGQGAFGGSRSALVEAERQRNLATQKGDIQAAGSQAAFQQAQQQFNADQARRLQAQQANQQYGLQAQQLGEQSRQFGAGQGLQSASLGAQYGQAANQLNEQANQYGAGLGMQGLQTALTGANALGSLGGQQFQQGMDINKLQNAYGGQQQALQQQGLTQAYEDFQNQNNYGYKQLGFMSDLIRGMPLGQQTATQMYAPNPSTAQNVAALGAGAYGLSKFMAEGGMAYADGGSVDSPDNVAAIVHTLSDQDLQKAMQAAQARGDQDQLEAIQNEMGMRASLKNGLASAVTPQMADGFAGGGILAFAGNDEENGPAGQLIVSPGNKKYYDTAGSYAMDALDRLRARKGYEGMTKAERAAAEQQAFERIQQFGGEDPYAPMSERIKGLEEAAAKNYERAQGASILAAIPKILEGGNAARGIAGGLGAYGTQIEQADRAHAAEKRGLAGIGFNLADAKRKERIAIGKEALGNVKDIEANRLAADAADRKAITEEISGASNLAKAYRPTSSGSGGAGKSPKLNERLYDDNVANLLATNKPKEGETDVQFNARIRAQAGELTAKQVKDMGQTRADAAANTLTAAQNRDLAKHMTSFMDSTEYRKALKAGTADELYNAEQARKQQELMGGITRLARGGNIEPIKLD